MKTYREIEFTTTRSRNGLTAGKTCYQGHLQHNAVPSEKETRRRFAQARQPLDCRPVPLPGRTEPHPLPHQGHVGYPTYTMRREPVLRTPADVRSAFHLPPAPPIACSGAWNAPSGRPISL